MPFGAAADPQQLLAVGPYHRNLTAVLEAATPLVVASPSFARSEQPVRIWPHR